MIDQIITTVTSTPVVTIVAAVITPAIFVNVLFAPTVK